MSAALDVRSFYERYPYPPPADGLEAYRERWRDARRRQAEYHLLWPARSYREDCRILVAGCGTSQAAKHAMRWPSARVTGIDFSATSVRHTLALKQRYRLDNLEVHQLPLERVRDLAARFDLIVCTGVLHHLADPEAGLRALHAVLEPEGALHLMVYAAYGRSGIYMLQEFCRRVGLQATGSDIEALHEALEALPSGHPAASLLRAAPDFRSPSALADALLHPRDRAYSVPQLFDLLRASGLSFGRWVRQAPYRLQPGLMSRLPRRVRTARMSAEDEYAAAELFRGTMARHSVIAYRNDNPRIPGIGFEGDDWLGYVPIRMPDTMGVEERLPPGIAAILINRTHAHPDICLPVRAREKPLLEEIDGRRAIGKMTWPRSDLGALRSFFERLWWHDQIAIDASRQSE